MAATLVASRHFYWYGVVVLYFGIFTLAIDVLFEGWSLSTRLAVCLSWVVVAGCIGWKFVWVPAPLSIESTSLLGNYGIGSNIFGIKWEPGMSELRVSISNLTPNDYHDLDFNLRPNVPTRLVGQVSHIPDVSLDIDAQAGPLPITNMVSEGIDPNGQIHESIVSIYASGMGFRLRCPLLPAKATIEIIAALVHPKYGPRSRDPAVITLHGGGPEQWVGPKQLATTLHVNGHYTVFNHPHQIDNTYTVGH